MIKKMLEKLSSSKYSISYLFSIILIELIALSVLSYNIVLQMHS